MKIHVFVYIYTSFIYTFINTYIYVNYMYTEKCCAGFFICMCGATQQSLIALTNKNDSHIRLNQKQRTTQKKLQFDYKSNSTIKT